MLTDYTLAKLGDHLYYTIDWDKYDARKTMDIILDRCMTDEPGDLDHDEAGKLLAALYWWSIEGCPINSDTANDCIEEFGRTLRRLRAKRLDIREVTNEERVALHEAMKEIKAVTEVRGE